ncbi:XAC2610-related protein [Pedobacter metabolipauper]|uniref:Uncharacterized protein n=1 Tax=Pedobacter metabolipauper TaxID=425513 RepID=A0A4R6SVD6_9SPHI|nr:hypothetical protein [Pedobacter metabolipauper]TDQ08321.1 hypothetical protein ATK78_2830 [Pedobacter metabolipauper]
MTKKIIPIIISLTIIFTGVNAQPFTLKSTGQAKSFQLKIYYGTQGKGAFVQYMGQSGIILLKIKSKVSSQMGHSARTTYVWNEIIEGKINGSYDLTEQDGQPLSAWYRRKKDGREFQLESKDLADSEMDKYLLHGALISFYHTYNDQLIISYPGNKKETMQLPDFDHPDPLRRGTIADYNFDGYDDVAFSIPDAGMGVYRIFSIFLYDPTAKRFKKLAEPNDSRANCSGLCDVTIDSKNTLLMSACRGAATWWKDTYRFSKGNKLIWVSSTKQE